MKIENAVVLVTSVCPGEMYTDSQGMQPDSTPRAMTTTDVAHAVYEYAKSARLAIEAGFDGVELHAANGYLIEQFLNANVNLRTDAYGGSVENRNRFAIEVTRAAAAAIGVDRAAAETALKAGQADLIAFARPFLANPDLVERMRVDAPLNALDMATFSTPGPKGYTDYPTLAVRVPDRRAH